MSYIKVSGGIFMDMTIHDFDMVRYLAGSEVTEVTAYGAALSGAGYEEYGDVDTAIVMMKFETATTSAPRFTATRAACRLQTI